MAAPRRLSQVLRELADGAKDGITVAQLRDALGDRGFAGKWTHYEQSLRVPLIIYDPRLPKEKRGKVVSEMALNSDLASTMIELGGQKPPTTHTGHSLVPLVHGEIPTDWRRDFLCEFLAVPGTIPRWEGVRDTDWVYARYYVDGPNQAPFEFLHDLKNDPDQLVNLTSPETGPNPLTAQQQSALAKLRERCDELISQNGPTMKSLPEIPKKTKSPKGKGAKKGDA